jgi:hypothetical protein
MKNYAELISVLDEEILTIENFQRIRNQIIQNLPVQATKDILDSMVFNELVLFCKKNLSEILKRELMNDEMKFLLMYVTKYLLCDDLFRR